MQCLPVGSPVQFIAEPLLKKLKTVSLEFSHMWRETGLYAG